MASVVTKAEILDEIRRTASENGGRPLGIARFQSETGIRRSEILGVHWARRGDALCEAGFSPNELQSAYSTEELIRFYVNLARELGHLPVKDEVKMKHRTNLGFPGWDPSTRLGTRADRFRAVAEFCRENPGYEHVLRRCQEKAVDSRGTKRKSRVRLRENSIGCVYLAKSGRYYKIGKSNAVDRRQDELGLQLPEKLKMSACNYDR
ncbi:MAG TPA: hypothetical protein VFW73_10530 [Lacipirellulaceae bacterium]|nr:hypothetical protein [Lacipirellulaceae bacterium]